MKLAIFIVGFLFLGSEMYLKNAKVRDSEWVPNDFFISIWLLTYPALLLLSVYIIDITDIILTITIVVITFILYLICAFFISRRSMNVTPQLIIKYFVILAAFNVLAFAARKHISSA